MCILVVIVTREQVENDYAWDFRLDPVHESELLWGMSTEVGKEVPHDDLVGAHIPVQLGWTPSLGGDGERSYSVR